MSSSNPRAGSPPTVRFALGELAVAMGERRLGMLTVLQGAAADLGAHWSIDRPLVIGRDPDVEVPLGDNSCSRRHARVQRDEQTGRFVVEDLGSTNGTLVNGVRITRHQLSDGDRVVVGSTVLKFSVTDDVERAFHEKVNELMNFDDLTGLTIKRRFDAELERAAAAARAQNRPLAILMMDLDNLKKINDAHGHHMGAHTISEVGKIIGAIIQPHGLTCRYGGDEFIAFLPEADKPQAVTVAEAIRRQVGQAEFVNGDARVRTTISIGVAAMPEDGQTADEVSKRADEALYRAKGRGRNVTSV